METFISTKHIMHRNFGEFQMNPVLCKADPPAHVLEIISMCDMSTYS